ncbi:DUF732 domain-containing protein [Mycolicibacterium vaccae]|uniref:DUF732 domain-containing protein n=1 Tax=Mycolicibacterium vaccae ATCC 25954 TaxID=1194972 RepID=K0UUM8_MYCVA|nr:DUF732 domain-containing protein [Mycolicibacterium vaccae]ANI42029.1 membrane protein [Mycolicibacterium vaccae 95051]EJZ10466.1 hypothetical protein MVAC_08899 [Mycolicibacterium vaccae ATCC 25954]
MALSVATIAAVAGPAPTARADEVAYLVNVTLAPGYDFAGVDAALEYGHGICRKLADGRTYPELIADVRADFRTADDYQASYLLGQAANELCPEWIPALRNSAAGYRPSSDHHTSAERG